MQMLSKGKDKVLSVFYRNKSKLYFSEIMRETKLTQATLLKHLSDMKKLGLLIVEKTIGHTYYRLNSDSGLLYSLFNVLDVERLGSIKVDLSSHPIIALYNSGKTFFVFDSDKKMKGINCYSFLDFKKEIRLKSDKDLALAIESGIVVAGANYFYKEVLGNL